MNNNSGKTGSKYVVDAYRNVKEYRYGNGTMMRGPYRLSASYVV